MNEAISCDFETQKRSSKKAGRKSKGEACYAIVLRK
jgi:hypothetical protein